MICKNCGKEIPNDCAFCGYCGSNITDGSKVNNGGGSNSSRKNYAYNNSNIINYILKGWIILVVLFVGAILFLIFCPKNDGYTPMSANYSKERIEAKKAEVAAEAEANKVDTSVVIEVQADQLVDSFKENAVGCKTKYNNKLVSVTGTIGLIGAFDDGRAFVLLCYKGDYSLKSQRVQCIFNKNNLDCIADLKKGQQVTIKGECKINSSEIQLNGSNIEV